MNKAPAYMSSPLAMMFAGIIACDEADRAIEFSQLQAKAGRAQMKRDAYQHALDCMETCDAQGIEYDSETLSHNVQCNYPELTEDQCDDIAELALIGAA